MVLTLRHYNVAIFILDNRLVSHWSYIVLKVSAHARLGKPITLPGKIGEGVLQKSGTNAATAFYGQRFDLGC